jgi:hypothetical protein
MVKGVSVKQISDLLAFAGAEAYDTEKRKP